MAWVALSLQPESELLICGEQIAYCVLYKERGSSALCPCGMRCSRYPGSLSSQTTGIAEILAERVIYVANVL